MRRASLARVIAYAALTIPSLFAAGFNPETGSYIFQQYGPADYGDGVSPQNWAITQDRRGVMYFGNTDGVLEFDGSSWRVIRLPERSVVYSVATDARGVVYVGGVGDFGFLQADAHGVMQFVSLKSRIPVEDREFHGVWRILPTSEGVYFSSYRRLFRLNGNGAIRVWRPDRKFGYAFQVLGGLYVQTAGTGLLRMQHDALIPVAGGEAFATDVVNDALQLNDSALIATNTKFYRLTSEGVEPHPIAASPELARGLMLSMRKLGGGEIAVGTRKSGLFLLDSHGSVDRVVSTDSDGLASDYVAAIYADHEGGIWLAGQNGLTRLNPGLTRFARNDGIDGNVECMNRVGGTLYAGTTKGLFRMVGYPGRKPEFERVEGIGYATWTLTAFSGGLIAATDQGVFYVTGNRASLMFQPGKPIWDLSISLQDQNVAYAAGRAGVFMLRRKGSEWAKVAELDMPGEEFRTVLEDSDGRVWATTTKNIWRLDFARQPVGTEKFDATQGVPAGWISARWLNGHITFATTKGLKRYSAKLRRFAPDVTLGSQFADGSQDVFNVFQGHDGNVWVTGEKYHNLLVRTQTGYRSKSLPLLPAGIHEIYWMSLDDDGIVWASGEKFVLHRWDSSMAGNPEQDFRVMTRRVVISNKDNDILYGGAGPFNIGRLPWKDNALRFEFAAPFLENPAAVQYQYKLEGSDRNWSEWSHEVKAPYTHLPEGSYRLRVRARSPHGAVSEDASLSFGVAPPWFRTWWAFCFYAVAAAFAIWGFVQARTKQLEADKRHLETVVEERTVEIKAQERKGHALLLNILPAAIADELKNTGVVKPVAFDDVTVCFTDFVGFTLSSENMQAGRLVDALNDYFTRFDEIIARYGLEKLKTIGDSYMFVSGLPEQSDAHAVDAVLAAMEMVDVVKELGAKAEGTGWNIRVGLHSGPVVAGVVGIRKFAFDIWGNTVNFAARMESSGVPGWVNMSERTCRLTRGLIECDGRGNVKIKEGRELPMFLARRPVAGFAARYKEEFGQEPRSIPAVTTQPRALVAS